MKKSMCKFRIMYGMSLKEMAEEMQLSIKGVQYRHRIGALPYPKLNSWFILDLPKDEVAKIRRVFHNIECRCNYPNTVYYKYYGGKGIKNEMSILQLSELWKRDKAASMKSPSISRIDHNKNYCIENCEFIELKDHNRIGCSERRKGKFKPLPEALKKKLGIT